MKVKVVCAWCGHVLSDSGAEVKLVSHGICPPCKTNMLTQAVKLSYQNRMTGLLLTRRVGKD